MTTPLPMPAFRRAPEVSDAQLVTRVLGGDTDAYAGLVRRHQDAIYRHARGLGLDHDASADVVQEALVKAFDHLEDCREGSNFKAWLFRICRNLCFDELRSVHHRRSVPMSEVEVAGDVEADPVMPDELTLTLRAALDRVPPDLRDAFLLKHDAGYTYEEIAVMTEASPSAVKMRVHRARETLRAFLRRQGLDSRNAETRSDNQPSVKRLSREDEIERQARIAGANGAQAKQTRRMS